MHLNWQFVNILTAVNIKFIILQYTIIHNKAAIGIFHTTVDCFAAFDSEWNWEAITYFYLFLFSEAFGTIVKYVFLKMDTFVIFTSLSSETMLSLQLWSNCFDNRLRLYLRYCSEISFSFDFIKLRLQSFHFLVSKRRPILNSHHILIFSSLRRQWQCPSKLLLIPYGRRINEILFQSNRLKLLSIINGWLILNNNVVWNTKWG